MRNTKVMLLAAMIASPMAFADGGYGGYGGYDDYDGDVTIEGSKNKTVTIDTELNYEKHIDKKKDYYSDDDKLLMKNVGNSYKKYKEDNSSWDGSIDSDIDKEINDYIASSVIYGTVMDAEVTYGGACCNGSAGDLVVDHSNAMGMAYNSASGISVAGQNVGNNSMVQQSTSTNAALVGSGVSPGTGGY